MKNYIYTIGHSNRSIEEFIKMLRSFNIQLVADVRSFPSSKKFPHFNKVNLEKTLTAEEINYVHLKDLGGRRKPREKSTNTLWKNDAFRGYADYMETENFKIAIQALEDLSKNTNVAIMCSEALWWRCHRSLISDYLKSNGWTVMHIMKENKAMEHPYTTVARLVQGI